MIEPSLRTSDCSCRGICSSTNKGRSRAKSGLRWVTVVIPRIENKVPEIFDHRPVAFRLSLAHRIQHSVLQPFVVVLKSLRIVTKIEWQGQRSAKKTFHCRDPLRWRFALPARD